MYIYIQVESSSKRHLISGSRMWRASPIFGKTDFKDEFATVVFCDIVVLLGRSTGRDQLMNVGFWLHVYFLLPIYTFQLDTWTHHTLCTICFCTNRFCIQDILRSRKDGSQRPYLVCFLSQATVELICWRSGAWHCHDIAVTLRDHLT